MALPTPQELDRLLVKKGGLYKFVQLAWDKVENVPFVGGWHLEEMCLHLEAVSRGLIKRLVVNVPPGMSKSLVFGVFWPVWDWATVPNPESHTYGWRKWMYASFDATLSQRDALRAKELIESGWFQERWGDVAKEVTQPLTIDRSGKKQDTATVYHVSGGGYRFSTSTGGKATGWHAHIQVIDDPTKPKDVEGGAAKTKTALDNTKAWFDGTMASRKADPKNFARVIIMQRLHEEDLAGHVLSNQKGWIHLRFPMEYSRKSQCDCPSCNLGPCKTAFGGDRRTEEGELLCPERFDREAVDTTKEDMGSMVASAQLDQAPSPAGGAIIKRPWLNKRWKVLPSGCVFLQSWDCSFKDLDTSSYVVGQLWARKAGEFFLVDEIRDHMDLPTTLSAIRDASKRRLWRRARAKLVEDKANGPAVISTLKRELSGIIAYSPGSSSKEARASAVAPYFEAGNVYLPEDADWVGDYVEELAKFPTGAYNDRVDATSQALLHMTSKDTGAYKRAMEKIRAGK